MAGISGSGLEGADSIVASGGYEDDLDEGETLDYTGHGGNDPGTGKQIADQELTKGNLALAKNAASGLPVRVVRGSNLDSPYAPSSGFRYDGLYFVENYWHERGKSGFLVWKFHLQRDDVAPPPWQEHQSLPPAGKLQTFKKATTTLRVVRDTAVARWVKELHNYTCQVCGARLKRPGGPYAEGAHIRPLGTPHNGPDTADNILCLCPNHHLLFDRGGFHVADDLHLIGIDGCLLTKESHAVNVAYLAYHRDHWGLPPRATGQI
jgi:putative restriction endonuclease